MTIKKSRMITAVLGIAAVMILAGGGTVFARVYTETTQTFRTGAVDIELQSRSGKTDPYGTDLLPGERVQMEMNVCNKAEPCYVRAKYRFDRYGSILTDRVSGISEDWIYNSKDGYWYLTKRLLENEKELFFDGFSMPETFPQERSGSFTLTVTAEALQQRNVTPDFDSEDPWMGIQPEKDVNSTYRSAEDAESGKMEIVYMGDADQVIADPEDLFSGLPALMPGDKWTRQITLRNDSEEPVSLYFFSQADDTLAEKLDLTINAGPDGSEKRIYAGSLNTRTLNGEENEICLGTLKSGETGSMTFAIRVPPEMTNRDAMKTGSVKWIFSTDHIPVPEESGPEHVKKPVWTGDSRNTGFWLSIMAAGFALMAAALYIYRKTTGGNGS